ncbi:nuclear transport factor 2 family protein [Sphingomonas jatrophae]|uniref:SnoaL-like domain-containing protein n=1 Tax=Sphingomonas jatrophae TaxID=1166337 RepID=A0A1I6KDX6_9SPHN|nr:nuclear transport factor 2 family protein [Sphingomonas jatrophae]SFR89060.1 SnoaL-like domain-containing protein [Sphingomonas jatrophae]
MTEESPNLRRRSLWSLVALPVGFAAAASAAKAAPRDDAAARLDRLEAKDACQSVLFDYARANDRIDEALLLSCFWPESQHHHGGFKGRSVEFAGFALKVLRGTKYTAHHISNVAIEVKGDQALSECYYFAHHRRDAKAGGEEDAFFEGRYLDRFERRGGVWKIIQRRGLADYSTVVPATTPYAAWPAGQHSERMPDDDYYAMRRAFQAR